MVNHADSARISQATSHHAKRDAAGDKCGSVPCQIGVQMDSVGSFSVDLLPNFGTDQSAFTGTAKIVKE